MIESGALILNYDDTDFESQDDKLLMPANDKDLFEDEERVIHDEDMADEFEEEFVNDDDGISIHQQEILQAPER
jgi:hypothetical protein